MLVLESLVKSNGASLLARINHQRCVSISEWMEANGFLKIYTENNRKELERTDFGKEYNILLNRVPLPNI